MQHISDSRWILDEKREVDRYQPTLYDGTSVRALTPDPSDSSNAAFFRKSVLYLNVHHLRLKMYCHHIVAYFNSAVKALSCLGTNQFITSEWYIDNGSKHPYECKTPFWTLQYCCNSAGEIRQSHTTIAVVEKHSDGTYVLKALKQKLFVDGLCYLLQEIYGIENKNLDTKVRSHAKVIEKNRRQSQL